MVKMKWKMNCKQLMMVDQCQNDENDEHTFLLKKKIIHPKYYYYNFRLKFLSFVLDNFYG